MMSAGRKFLASLAAVAAVAVLVAAGVWYFLASRSNTAEALREYVARQVVDIVNAYLVPTLDFQDVAFELPGTVRFTGARLTSPDGIDVLDLDTLVITLAEMPEIGKPIRVARVEIRGGAVNLVQDEEGKFQGLQPMLRRGVRDGSVQVASENRLSNVLRLERVTIEDVALAYDDGTGAPPMLIEGFAADLDIKPDAERGVGWYTMAVQAGRSPGLTVDLEGAFGIDDLIADISRGAFAVTLDDSTIGSLPPQLQDLILAIDGTGSARVEATGRVPLERLAESAVSIDAVLEQFNIAQGEYRLPIELFEARIDIADGLATMADAVARTMEGQVSISADADLRPTNLPLRARWSISGVSLQAALRSGAPEDAAPKLAGILTGSGTISTALRDPQGGVAGQGELHVRDGRLLVLPGIAEILQDIGRALTDVGGEMNHRGDATFDLDPAGVRVTKSEVVTGVLAARATGVVGYDGALDLTVHAGPLERVQNALGVVGDIFGRITDRLVAYRVRGTVSEPTVSVSPLGVGG